MKIAEALGPRTGDELTISNQWAKVTISREQDAPHFIVTGDLADFRTTSKEFTKLGDAVDFAFTSLATYQRGRAD